jgi:cytidylate kinase
MPIVAIDGPAGTGKSTVTKRLSRAVGLRALDTGSLYRAVTWLVLNVHEDPKDADTCAHRTETMLQTIVLPEFGRVRVGGIDISSVIRSAEVAANVSHVAAHAEVRDLLLELQRNFVLPDGGIVEGRDIGSKIFPNADLKLYLTASPEIRAKRRHNDGGESGIEAIARRDRLDSTRTVSPLQITAGAIVVDTTESTIAQVVNEIIAHYRTIVMT